MNDNTAFERTVAETFDREGRGRPVPDAIHDELLTYAGRTRQWPSWLASIKEPPMRLANQIAVGSPTVRVAAVFAATLLLALLLAAAGIAGQRLFAASADYIVDPDGGGDFTTIAEAVAVAQDGESILVKNGTYLTESVTITEDITLTGESRDGVVIEFGASCALEGEGEFAWEKELVCEPGVLQLAGDGQLFQAAPYALHLSDSGATLSDLTFRHLSPGYGIYVTGGAPTIERVTFADSTRDNPNGGNNLMLRGGTSAIVTDADIGEGAAFVIEDDSPVTVADSNGGGLFSVAPRDEASGGPATVRNNTLAGTLWAEGLHEITGNEIDLTDNPWEQAGIFLNRALTGWVVEGNTVRGSTGTAGIDIGDGVAGGLVADNVLEGNTVGIFVSGVNSIEVNGNQVRDGDIGIRAIRGVSGLRDNTVEGMSDIGIDVAGLGDLTLSENRGCGSVTDLKVSFASSAVVDDTNEFCVVDDQRED